jgi:uncharacterized membrane protein YraQ (UPF0718 family)
MVTGLAMVASLIASRQETIGALRIAVRRFVSILPAFLIMLILVSIVLCLIPDEVIIRYLGADAKYAAVISAAALGSITLMPGFIAFPLAGVLLEKGVLYMVLSAFTTTLMMVGVLTYPVERAYFGTKVTIIRNVISFLIALAIAIITGIVFGEIF